MKSKKELRYNNSMAKLVTTEEYKIIERIAVLAGMEHDDYFIYDTPSLEKETDDYFIYDTPSLEKETRYDVFRAREMGREFYWNSKQQGFDEFILAWGQYKEEVGGEQSWC